ncbi:MAG: hypothetical protein ACE366_10985 [Bradymonadia bacterium]
MSGRCTVLDGPSDMGVGVDEGMVQMPDMGDSDTMVLTGVYTPQPGIEDFGDKTVIIDGLQLSGNAIPFRIKARTIIVRNLNANGAGYLGGGGGGGGAGGAPSETTVNGGTGGSRMEAVSGGKGDNNTMTSGGDGGDGGDGNGVGSGSGGDGGQAGGDGARGTDAIYNDGNDPCALLAPNVRYVIGASGGGGGGGAGSNADVATCTVGSGGGGGGTGGNGGGAIELEATEEIVIEGSISAIGRPADADPTGEVPGAGACIIAGAGCEGTCIGGDGGDGVDPQVTGSGTTGGAGGIGSGMVDPGGNGGGGGAGSGGTVVLVSPNGVRFAAGASIDLSGAGANDNKGSLRIFGPLQGNQPGGSGFHLCQY